MDAVDPDVFARITRVPGSYDRVLAGVRTAKAVPDSDCSILPLLWHGFGNAPMTTAS